MARTTLEAWLPEEYDSNVLTLVGQTSAIDQIARKIPMGSDTKNVPRSNGIHVEVVPKGGAYGEDGGANDGVTMYARKFGKVIRLAEEDIDDSVADVIAVKKADWATSYAKTLDNACLGTTAADNGTTVPFTSVYRALSQVNAATSYTAGANIFAAGTAFGTVTFTDAGDIVTSATPHGLAVGDKVKFGTITSTTGIVAGTTYFVRTVPSTTTVTLSATLNGGTLILTTDGSAASMVAKSGQASYDNLNNLISNYEASDYFDEGKGFIIAHPSLKGQLRGLKNANGDPIFVENPRKGDPETLFGYDVKFSAGARTSAVATDTPTGNPLVVMGNRDFLMLGVRSGPESVVIDGRSGASALTDETLVKVRSRRGFVIGHEKAFVILEIA